MRFPSSLVPRVPRFTVLGSFAARTTNLGNLGTRNHSQNHLPTNSIGGTERFTMRVLNRSTYSR